MLTLGRHTRAERPCHRDICKAPPWYACAHGVAHAPTTRRDDYEISVRSSSSSRGGSVTHTFELPIAEAAWERGSCLSVHADWLVCSLRALLHKACTNLQMEGWKERLEKGGGVENACSVWWLKFGPSLTNRKKHGSDRPSHVSSLRTITLHQTLRHTNTV